MIEPAGSITPGVGAGCSMRIRPKSAAVTPSQCCSKVASNSSRSPASENVTAFTSNSPLYVPHPPIPVTAMKGAPAAAG